MLFPELASLNQQTAGDKIFLEKRVWRRTRFTEKTKQIRSHAMGRKCCQVLWDLVKLVHHNTNDMYRNILCSPPETSLMLAGFTERAHGCLRGTRSTTYSRPKLSSLVKCVFLSVYRHSWGF